MSDAEQVWKNAVRKAKTYHRGNKTFTGLRTMHSFPSIRALCAAHAPATLLDYGCGKGYQWRNRDIEFLGETLPSLAEVLGVTPTLYDPGLTKFSAKPGGVYDAVIVIDALEYVPASHMDRVVTELFSYATRFVYFHASTQRPAKDCVVEEAWDRPPEFWVGAFARAAYRRPEVTWYGRVKRPERDNVRETYAGRGNVVLSCGDGQFEPAEVAQVKELTCTGSSSDGILDSQSPPRCSNTPYESTPPSTSTSDSST